MINAQVKNVPKKIEYLKDIQQVSFGTRGGHILAKDSQNTIFVIGSNWFGQLGTGDTYRAPIPKEINPKYFTIWGDYVRPSKCKSARK